MRPTFLSQRENLIEPYLDEYLVAADLLADHQMDVVAEALRTMALRVLHMFTGQQMTTGARHDLSKLWEHEDWVYASDGQIAIRIKSSIRCNLASGKTSGMIHEVFDRLWFESEGDEPNDGGYDWLPVKSGLTTTRFDGGFFAEIGGRRIADWNYRKLLLLPDPEYLDDIADYVFEEITPPPLRFRFRCGEGVCMPLAVDSDGTESNE